jgi:membrane fusion protein, multidrug efflux system
MKSLKKKKKLIMLFILILISVIIGIGYYIYTKNKIYTNDAYISGHSSYISPHIAGYVNNVLAHDNQFVSKGQLLVTIDPTPFQENVKECKAKLNIENAQLNTDIHIEGVARAKLKFALLQYKRYKYLSETHAQSIEIFQSFTSGLNQEKANFQAKLVKIQQDDAAIKQANADLSIAKINLSYTKIYAPFDGWVTKKTVALGNYVTQGEALMAIVPINLYIQANYKETKLTNLQNGQPVSIHIDSYPNITFKGHVDSIQSGSGAAFSLLPPENATGNFVKIVQRIPVKIVFDKIPDPDKYKLSIGMSVETTIKIG